MRRLQRFETRIRRKGGGREGEGFDEASPSLAEGSDKLHPEQLTGALKFSNAETLQGCEVRRDRLSSAPATRRSISRASAEEK